MEYIFSGNGYKIIIYDEGNNVLYNAIGKGRVQRIRLLAKDYSRSLVCARLGDYIHCAYISVSGELVWIDGERDISVVLYEGKNELWDMEGLKLFSVCGGLVLIYEATNPVTGKHEIRYIALSENKKSGLLAVSDESVEETGLIGDSYLYFRYREKRTIRMYSLECKGPEKIKAAEMEIYPAGYVEEQKEKIADGYKSQYMELYEFTKKLQEEGKQWRERFYSSKSAEWKRG